MWKSKAPADDIIIYEILIPQSTWNTHRLTHKMNRYRKIWGFKVSFKFYSIVSVIAKIMPFDSTLPLLGQHLFER